MDRQRSLWRTARRGPTVSLAATGFFLLALAQTAAADVVTGPPPEDDCPEGSRGENCRGYGHGSDHCSPRRCTSDEACGEGGQCEEAALCISQVECSSEPDGGATYEDNVVGPCEDDGGCSEGTCQTLMVCATAPVFRSAGGCDCSLSPSGRDRGPLVVMLLGVAAALGLIRRRL